MYTHTHRFLACSLLSHDSSVATTRENLDYWKTCSRGNGVKDLGSNIFETLPKNLETQSEGDVI